MSSRVIHAAFVCQLAALAVFGQSAAPQMARFHTNLGDIDVILLSGNAPKTVANFLNYVNRADRPYDNSIIHRSIPGFIWQGGGYHDPDPTMHIHEDSPVINEYSV